MLGQPLGGLLDISITAQIRLHCFNQVGFLQRRQGFFTKLFQYAAVLQRDQKLVNRETLVSDFLNSKGTGCFIGGERLAKCSGKLI